MSRLVTNLNACVVNVKQWAFAIEPQIRCVSLIGDYIRWGVIMILNKNFGIKALILMISISSLMFLGVHILSVNAADAQAAGQDKIDRHILPIAEPVYPHSTTLDVRNATPPPFFQVKAPSTAPNVLIVLIDDMGFGQSSAFGGPVHMPTLEKLANDGLRYNNFHTTALCSPTRAALLSGRNHHMCNMGSITETATAFPGQTGKRPNSVAPLAEMLRLNGYATAAFGKSHETAAWEVSPSGPTDHCAYPQWI